MWLPLPRFHIRGSHDVLLSTGLSSACRVLIVSERLWLWSCRFRFTSKSISRTIRGKVTRIFGNVACIIHRWLLGDSHRSYSRQKDNIFWLSSASDIIWWVYRTRLTECVWQNQTKGTRLTEQVIKDTSDRRVEWPDRLDTACQFICVTFYSFLSLQILQKKKSRNFWITDGAGSNRTSLEQKDSSAITRSLRPA